MAEVKKIILIQPVDNVLGDDALIPGLQRDLEHNFERSNSTEGSKMGSVTSSGALTETITAGFLFQRGDEGQQALKRAIREGLEVKVWIIDPVKVTAGPNAGKYPVTFGYTVIGSLSETSPYEGVEELSTELTVQIKSVDGFFDTLPPGLAEFAAYGFELPGDSTGSHNNRTTEPVEENQNGGGV